MSRERAEKKEKQKRNPVPYLQKARGITISTFEAD